MIMNIVSIHFLENIQKSLLYKLLNVIALMQGVMITKKKA